MKAKLDIARERKIKAGAVVDARNNANWPATVAAISKAQMDVSSYVTQSGNLTDAWNAVRLVLA